MADLIEDGVSAEDYQSELEAKNSALSYINSARKNYKIELIGITLGAQRHKSKPLRACLDTDEINILKEILIIESIRTSSEKHFDKYFSDGVYAITRTSEDNDNYLSLVALSSILLESKLSKAFAENMRPIAAEVVQEMKSYKRNYNTEIIDRWCYKEVETTLGIIVSLMRGLRWSINNNNTLILKYINSIFIDEYSSCAAKPVFSETIEEIRAYFRNPLLHGRKTFFSETEYKHLSSIMVGKSSFHEWCRSFEQCENLNTPTVLHAHIKFQRENIINNPCVKSANL